MGSRTQDESRASARSGAVGSWHNLRAKTWQQVIAAVLQTLFHPVVRYNQRLVWEARCRHVPGEISWSAGEQLIVLEPDNIDRLLEPELKEFLGGPSASSELDGVRGGDRLFVVRCGPEYLAYSYLFFPTTPETRRQVRILDEPDGTPVIGMSYTAPAARGRGLYRRILAEMFLYLQGIGIGRAVCEVHPENLPSNRASEAAGMQVCRRLSDWTILNHLVVQRLSAGTGVRWRALWV